MNTDHGDDDTRVQDSRGGISNRSKSKLAAIAVAALVGVYSLAAPRISERFGLDLPLIRADSQGRVEVVDERNTSRKRELVAADSGTAARENRKSSNSTASSSTKPRGPLADRLRSTAKQDSPASAKEKADPPASENDMLFGLLREVSRDRYISPAGLMYTPGSAEGHRLEHLRRHTKDDPRRPGSHGVFDGEMEGALKTIDRAYETR